MSMEVDDLIPDDLEEYYMENEHRGHVLIIANEKFDSPQIENRYAAKQDVRKMKALFEALDFKVTYFMDLKAHEMKQEIENVSKSPDNRTADCFVLVISSHGHEEQVTNRVNGEEVWRQAIKGVDDAIKGVDDKRHIFVDNILEMFDDKINKACTLKGKPKLFFLQACRSGHLKDRDGILGAYDTGTNIKVSVTNLSNVQPTTDEFRDDKKFINAVDRLAGSNQSDLPPDSDIQALHGFAQLTLQEPKDHVTPIPCPEDCLVMYPAMPGKLSFRYEGIGSYMISYMFLEKFRNLLLQEQCDILQYLTFVNNAMAKTEIEFDPTVGLDADKQKMLRDNMPFKITACLDHRLTKILKFHPKPNAVWQKLKEEGASFKF